MILNFQGDKNHEKDLVLTLLVATLAILISCTSPSTATVIPPTQTPTLTPTAILPTSTSLPSTPSLDGLLLSNEILSTEMDGLARYALNNAGWEPISPDVLSNELAALEGWDYARNEQGALQIVDLEGNPLWIETSGLWIQFSAELPEEFKVVNNGQNLVDANGNLLEWMKFVDGIMVITENPRESLDLAHQISEDAVWIKDDYAYNTQNGIVAMFIDNAWTETPNMDEVKLNMQWVGGGVESWNEHRIVVKTIKYGDLNKGAKTITDSAGNTIHVGYSAETLSLNSSGQLQVAEVPIIYWSSDGTKVVLFDLVYDKGDEFPLSQWMKSVATLDKNDIIGLSYLDVNKQSGIPHIYERGEIIDDTSFSLNEDDMNIYLSTGDLPASKDGKEIPLLLPNMISLDKDN